MGHPSRGSTVQDPWPQFQGGTAGCLTIQTVAPSKKHFHEWSVEPQVPPLRFAPVPRHAGAGGMTKGTAVAKGGGGRSTTVLSVGNRHFLTTVLSFLSSRAKPRDLRFLSARHHSAGKSRWVPQVSLLRPGILAIGPKWKRTN